MPDNSIPFNPDQKTAVAGPADFDENGALTRDFLLRREHCCQEGCRNCPYGFAPGESRGSMSKRSVT
jgi:hypothetical protein